MEKVFKIIGCGGCFAPGKTWLLSGVGGGTRDVSVCQRVRVHVFEIGEKK